MPYSDQDLGQGCAIWLTGSLQSSGVSKPVEAPATTPRGLAPVTSPDMDALTSQHEY